MASRSRGSANVGIDVEQSGVQAMMAHLDTTLNPVAIAGFLGATVDPYIRERARARFASEGDDVTGGWAPLGFATQSIRAQMGFGASHPINKRTGALEEYIVDSPNAIEINPLGAVLRMPGVEATGELGSKMRTAQKGKPDPRTVARPVIGLNEKDLLFVLTAISFYVGKAPGGI